MIHVSRGVRAAGWVVGLVWAGMVIGHAACGAAEPVGKVVVSPGVPEGELGLVHTVESEYQSRPTQIRVLVPKEPAGKTKRPVVYLLPVEAGREDRYGDGLKEIRERGLDKEFPAIFVAPTFSALPWYADHPTDAAIRQESHFVKGVVPFIEKTYPCEAEANGRLLVGFSKSGWGAYSLLLRHPKLFGAAAAWDAPLMMDKPGRYGNGPIFGGEENFERYRITRLFREAGAGLGKSPRLVLLGYGSFRAEHIRAHELLDELSVPHIYRDGPAAKHDWHSGWVRDALTHVFATRTK